MVSGGLGATTVAGALAVCRIAGIHFMATGGLGGVHRGWQQTRDVSADTYEIAFAAVCVVCSGVKSLLDVSATLEELETRGIPVIGYGTDRFPLFYQRDSPHHLPDRVDDPATVAALAATHWGFARAAGVIVANPVAEEAALSADEIEPAVDQALAEAEAAGIRGARRHAVRAGTRARADRGPQPGRKPAADRGQRRPGGGDRPRLLRGVASPRHQVRVRWRKSQRGSYPISV